MVERELRKFVGSRADLPTKTGLVAAGQAKLYTALRSHGGATYWAERLGLRITLGRLDRD
jgi:hypothetical protein